MILERSMGFELKRLDLNDFLFKDYQVFSSLIKKEDIDSDNSITWSDNV
jgi:hypothetical protein